MHSPKPVAFIIAALIPIAASTAQAPPQPDAGSPSQASPAALPPGVVATVNGVAITRDTISDHLWREWGLVQLSYAVRSKIVRMEAERRGITVSPEELQARMTEYQAMFTALPGRQPRDWELFLQQFGREGIEERQRDEMLAEKVGEDEAGKTTLSDEDRARVMADLERASEKVRARHILIGIGDGYDGRTEAQARVRADEARARLGSETDWSAVALEYSDDVSTRELGGDLGFFTRDQMVKPLEEAAFAAKPGDPPTVIRVPEGLDILQVTDRKTEPPTPEQVQAAMDQALARKKEIARTVPSWFPEAEKRYQVVTLLPYERTPEPAAARPATRPASRPAQKPAAKPAKKPAAKPAARPATRPAARPAR